MKTFNCCIVGVTPLLMHRWTENEEVQKNTRKIHVQNVDPRKEAEKHCYRSEDGSIFFPTASIARLLRETGAAHKQRGSRKSIKFIIPAAVILCDDEMYIMDPEIDEDATTYEVDSRPVVIPSTKGRIMRHRPRFNRWATEFSLEIDDEMIDADLVHQLITEGGKSLGIGDFRPERSGPFGRFHIVRWAEIAEKKPIEVPEPPAISRLRTGKPRAKAA